LIVYKSLLDDYKQRFVCVCRSEIQVQDEQNLFFQKPTDPEDMAEVMHDYFYILKEMLMK